LPVLTAEYLRTFDPPLTDNNRLRIALSHEFVELYRGDKDLRIGKMLCDRYNCEVVHLGANIASPADSRVFDTTAYPVDHIGTLPRDYYLLLMKSRLVFHRRGNISLGGFFRWTPGIVSELARWRPDLIFENPYLTLTPRSYMTYLVSRKLNIPLVYLDAGDIMPRLTFKHKIILPIEKQVVKKASAIITYNDEGKKRFINKYGCPGNKIQVIPKPIDTARFNPDLDCRGFKQKYDLENKFVVAYFGRLCDNKGARHLLYAADILRQRGMGRDIVFLFVGGNIEVDQAGEFKDHLNSLNLDNVRLTGMMANQDMPSAYAAVDMAVFPDVTNLPGFSTVLAESMAAGLPIAIGIKGWEDAVPIVDGINGLIIEHANPGQIADKIELLKNDYQLRQKLAENVLRFARQEMDYNRVVDKYFNIFRELTGKTVEMNKNEIIGRTVS